MRANFHTHSTFCDGQDTPRRMCERAAELGFEAIGFTGHSYTAFDGDGMDAERAAGYRAEIARLQEEYAGQMEVYCGIEQDLYSGPVPECYDYAIGSVHYMLHDGEYLWVDMSAAQTQKNIELYGGDACAYAEDYFALVGSVLDVTGADIVGHFDLITKYMEQMALPVTHPRWEKAAMDALDRLCANGRRPVFEINTGAMASGYRATPYPAPDLLREIRARGCPIMISSDCHDRRMLDFGYEAAAAAARDAGYREQVRFRDGTFVTAPL